VAKVKSREDRIAGDQGEFETDKRPVVSVKIGDAT